MVAMTITKVTAPAIPIAVEMRFDTPKKGHIPKNCANTMLLTKIADIIIMKYVMIMSSYAFLSLLITAIT
jgi:hypothetical protein